MFLMVFAAGVAIIARGALRPPRRPSRLYFIVYLSLFAYIGSLCTGLRFSLLL